MKVGSFVPFCFVSLISWVCSLVSLEEEINVWVGWVCICVVQNVFNCSRTQNVLLQCTFNCHWRQGLLCFVIIRKMDSFNGQRLIVQTFCSASALKCLLDSIMVKKFVCYHQENASFFFVQYMDESLESFFRVKVLVRLEPTNNVAFFACEMILSLTNKIVCIYAQ